MRAPMSPRAMLAGPLEVLVGTPMPDRSKVRGQTKSHLPALQVMAMSPAKKLPLQKLLSTGRQKGNASGVALRSHGDGQLRRK